MTIAEIEKRIKTTVQTEERTFTGRAVAWLDLQGIQEFSWLASRRDRARIEGFALAAAKEHLLRALYEDQSGSLRRAVFDVLKETNSGPNIELLMQAKERLLKAAFRQPPKDCHLFGIDTNSKGDPDA